MKKACTFVVLVCASVSVGSAQTATDHTGQPSPKSTQTDFDLIAELQRAASRTRSSDVAQSKSHILEHHQATFGSSGVQGRTAQNERQTASSYSCSSGCAPSCIANNFNLGCFELFWSIGAPIQGNEGWNVPWNTVLYYDLILMSPSNICSAMSFPTNLLMAPTGGSYTTLDTIPASSPSCCLCYKASDDGWETFTLPDDTAGAQKGWNSVGISTNQIAPLSFQNIFVTVEDRVDLSVEAISVDKETVEAGGSVDVSGRFLNYGECAASNVVLSLYLSPDNDVTTSDELIGTFSYLIDPIGGNPNSLGYMTWNIDDAMIPADKTIGEYYLAVHATSDGPVSSACGLITADYDPGDNWSDVIDIDIECTDNTVDLAVDSNGDLTIDLAMGGTDDLVEELLPGLLVAVNNNDSDGDEQLDHRDTISNGTSDATERRRIDLWFDNTLATNPDPNIANGEILLRFKEASNANNCRIFDQYDAYVLGAGTLDEEDIPLSTPIDSLSIDLTTTANQTYYIEGVLPGTCDLEIVFAMQDGSEVCDDDVVVTSFEAVSVVHGEYEDDGEGELGFDDGIPWSTDTNEALYGTWINTGNVVLSDGCEVQYGVVGLVGSTPTISPTVAYTSSYDPNESPQATYTEAIQTGSVGTSFRFQSQITKIKYAGIDYQVVGVLQQTRPIDIVAGTVSQVDSTSTDGLTYPASQIDQRTILVDVLQDSYGNPISNGTEVESEIDGMSAIDTLSTGTVTTNGQVAVSTIAGSDAETLKEAIIGVGEYELVHDVDVLGVLLQDAEASPSTVEAGSNNSVQLLVEVIGTDGWPVADGTPIVWSTSLGSLSTGITPTGPIAEGLVQGGAASATLYTAATNKLGTLVPNADRPGTAQVTIQCGYAETTFDVVFTSPQGSGSTTPIRLEVDHRNLTGNLTSGGSAAMPGLNDDLMFDKLIEIQNHMGAGSDNCLECDVDGDGVIELDDFIQACQAGDTQSGTGAVVSYYTDSTLTVYGDPSDAVQISVSDPTLVYLSGVDASNQLTLDALGTGTFMAHSWGNQPPDTIQSVAITATRVTRGGSSNRLVQSSEDSDTHPMSVVSQELQLAIGNFTAGFLWGGGSGLTSLSGDIVSGFWFLSLYGDTRDLASETFKLWPGGEDPNGWIAGLALLGFTDVLFPNAIGSAAGTLKAVARKINRIVPTTAAAKLTRNIVSEIGKELLNGTQAFLDKFDEYKALFEAMSKDQNFIRFLAGCTIGAATDSGSGASGSCSGGSDKLIKTSRVVLDRYGDAWATHIVKVADELGSNVPVRKALEALDGATASATTLNRIKQLSTTDQQRLLRALANCNGRFDQVVNLSARRRIRKYGGRVVRSNRLLSSEAIERIEDAQLTTRGPGESFVDCIENIGVLSAKGAEGLDELVGSLTNVISLPRTSATQSVIVGLENEIALGAKLAADTQTATLTLGQHLRDQVVFLFSSNEVRMRNVGEFDALRTLQDGRKIMYEFTASVNEKKYDEIHRRLRIRAIWGNARGYDYVLLHSKLDLSPEFRTFLGYSSYGTCKVRVVDDVLEIPSS